MASLRSLQTSKPTKRRREHKEEVEPELFMLKVPVTMGPDLEHRSIHYRLVTVPTKRDAIRIGQEYLIELYQEGKRREEFIADMEGDESLGDLYEDARETWRGIEATPLKQWLEGLQADWKVLSVQE